MPSDVLAQRRPSKRQVLTHPWHILLWLRDPDQWISEFATSRRDSATQLKPFHPDPLIFPVTYEPLRILQMVTIAKEMALNQSMMHSIMRQVLIQQAMGDEWFRVLLLERRVTLGVAVMVGYIWSTFSLFWTVARASRLSALLLLPSVFA
jgi:tryptophan-rich sensory protein